MFDNARRGKGIEKIMSDVVSFPGKNNKKVKPLSAKDIDFIGFMTEDGREFWCDKQEDIAKIFAFIARAGISVYCEK